MKPLHSIIKNPRVTEKAVRASSGLAYTFDVAGDANKTEIAKAIKIIYKVTPIKVNVSTVRPKTLVRRGIKGRTAWGKKAVVFLKKGDSINIY